MLFVLFLALSCTIAIIYESEEGTYTGSIMYRFAASNQQTVHLDQGEYIEWELSICADSTDSTSIFINNITLTYTNDGASDTLYMYLENTYIGQFTTHSSTNSGAYWNVPSEAVLDGSFIVSSASSSHTLKIVAQNTDTYGVEVDKIDVHLSIPSTSIGQCYATIHGISDLNVSNMELTDLFVIKDYSVITTCAEEDNILTAVIANPKYNDSIKVDSIIIPATYVIYFGDNPPNKRGSNFTSCNFSSDSDNQSPIETTQTLFDDGYLIIESVYVSNWWLGSFMEVTVFGGSTVTNAAYWRVTQKLSTNIEDYQQTFVMYQDGNIRLLPHPPTCYGDWIPFGSSIIIGNTVSDVQENRPFAEISTVNIYPSNDYKHLTAEVLFVNGDSMSIALDVGIAYTQITVSDIQFSDPTGSLVTFRSMYVSENNNDVDSLRINEGSVYDIMQLSNAFEGSVFEFGRKCISKHNTLSPDISFIMNAHITNITLSNGSQSNSEHAVSTLWVVISFFVVIMY